MIDLFGPYFIKCFCVCGQVIVSSDTVLSVRATVLLGQVLHLASLLLPHEIGSLSQSLPELAQHVATQHFVSCVQLKQCQE